MSGELKETRRTNNAATTEAGSGGDTGHVEAGDGIAEGVASTALGDIVEANALRRDKAEVSFRSMRAGGWMTGDGNGGR